MLFGPFISYEESEVLSIHTPSFSSYHETSMKVNKKWKSYINIYTKRHYGSCTGLHSNVARVDVNGTGKHSSLL
jgi:hypothetical protein